MLAIILRWHRTISWAALATPTERKDVLIAADGGSMKPSMRSPIHTPSAQGSQKSEPHQTDRSEQGFQKALEGLEQSPVLTATELHLASVVRTPIAQPEVQRSNTDKAEIIVVSAH